MNHQQLFRAALLLSASSVLAACEATTWGDRVDENPIRSSSERDSEAEVMESQASATAHGTVRVESYGIAEAAPGGASGVPLRGLAIRMDVTNDDDRDWSIDTRKQRIRIAGRGFGAPTFAAADRGTTEPPIVTVPAQGKRTVDLFFALPVDMQAMTTAPAFDADWQVGVGSDVETGSAAFNGGDTPDDREAGNGDPMAPYAWNGALPGPYAEGFDFSDAWYDPAYPVYDSFDGSVFVGPFYRDHQAHLRRLARGDDHRGGGRPIHDRGAFWRGGYARDGYTHGGRAFQGRPFVGHLHTRGFGGGPSPHGGVSASHGGGGHFGGRYGGGAHVSGGGHVGGGHSGGGHR